MQTKEKRGETSATAQKAKRTVKTAFVFIDFDGSHWTIEYKTIKELMHSIQYLKDNEYDGFHSEYDDDIFVELPNGRKFYWHLTPAHYCFAEGHLSERSAFNWMLSITKEKKGVAS